MIFFNFYMSESLEIWKLNFIISRGIIIEIILTIILILISHSQLPKQKPYFSLYKLYMSVTILISLYISLQ